MADVTPVPLNVTPVAPERPAPYMVVTTVEPGAAEAGDIHVIVGKATVNPLNGAVGPEGVVTVTVCEPKSAPGAIATAIDRLVAVDELITAETPVPLNVTP